MEEYFLQFFNMEEQFKKINIYYPNNDFNLFLWSAIPYAMIKLRFPKLEKITFDEVTTLRKDGGNYFAFAYTHKEIKESDDFNYDACVDMLRQQEELSIKGWQLNTTWSNREINWRDNITSDYIGLYHFINGELIENNTNIDAYRRLIDKVYLLKIENGYRVNIVYCKNKEIMDKFNEILPAPSEKLAKLEEKLYKAVYDIEKVGQPIHIHKVLKFLYQNRLALLKPYVLKNLVDRGLLREPGSEEAKVISTILFIES